MASIGQMTVMCGVYLVAAELSRRGFIVSPTSRGAAGADLLVTDQACRKAWSVQVKTNAKAGNIWLVGRNARKLISESYVYVFVNLKDKKHPDDPVFPSADYLVVPSAQVAKHAEQKERSTGSIWYWIDRKKLPAEGLGWKIFGDPHADPDPETPDDLSLM